MLVLVLVPVLASLVKTRLKNSSCDMISNSDRCPLIQRYLCTVYGHAGKGDLSMDY